MAKEHWLLPEKPYKNYAAYQRQSESSLTRALEMTPATLIEEVQRSGLRGRGGAGFSTGVKWQSLAQHTCKTRYVVCNAAEGEPGTFKDRFLLRKNPYAVLEGMAIAGHAIGAKAGYIALKTSFQPEMARLRQALEEMANSDGLADFPIHVIEGPEEYLFGEEKALLNVIEGEGPLPRSPDEPPYEIGLFATATSPNPALVSNAETFAHVPSIIAHGAASFRAIGTSDTPGTILFTLSGDVQKPGVYELPAGIPLRQLFYDIAGGPKPGRQIKAVLSGVSTGVLVPSHFDTPAEFGALRMTGSGLGSAGFVIYDDQTSMVRVAQAVTRFLYVESCNQCSACKVGLRIASSSLDELFGEKHDPALIERALIGAQHAPQGNRCYLPVQGATLVSSLLRHFGEEFKAQASTGATRAEVVLPKIVDFNEQTRTFSYDEKQARKLPNWTYAPAADGKTSGATAEPAKQSRGSVTVHLAPDLVESLLSTTDSSKDLHHHVDAALREWLASRNKK